MNGRYDPRTELMLLEDIRRGLADVAAGRTVDADEAARRLQARRAAQQARPAPQTPAPMAPKPPAG